MSVTFSGGITFTGGGFSFTAPPSGPYQAGWIGGGGPSYAYSSIVDRITYATDTATASVRGPLSSNKYGLMAVGTLPYGWFAAGISAASYPSALSTVDRITYATDTATASVRGPLSYSTISGAASGNDTYGWVGGGTPSPAGGTYSRVSRITYATDTATATSRGPLSSPTRQMAAAGNTTDGWFAGGYVTPTAYVSTVQRITYSNDNVTASVRGSLSTTIYIESATSDGTTYGYFGGGYNTGPGGGLTSKVQRITYANDTAAVSIRGPLSSARSYAATTGNSTDGWFCGGMVPGPVSTVDRITYATDTATASVKGPLSMARIEIAGTSGGSYS